MIPSLVAKNTAKANGISQRRDAAVQNPQKEKMAHNNHIIKENERLSQGCDMRA
jgi:hypothetical protein